MILSILTPAVPSRLERLGELCRQLAVQIGSQPVEHLVLLDNKRRTVGEKRDALLRSARGQYVAFVDDDDWVSDDYVDRILEAVRNGDSPPDVITFLQQATVNGATGTIEFRLGHPNESFTPSLHHSITPTFIKRNAWHVCAWRRSLAILSHFPATNYGEDWAWAAPLCRLPNLREVHIPAILHHYQHDARTTEAPAPQ